MSVRGRRIIYGELICPGRFPSASCSARWPLAVQLRSYLTLLMSDTGATHTHSLPCSGGGTPTLPYRG